MVKLPKPKRGKTKRTHIPALNENDLIVTLDKLSKLPIPAASKRVLSDILRAASNPHGESTETVIKALPPERRKLVGRSTTRLAKVTNAVTKRGAAALNDLSEDEWQRLVDASNADPTNSGN